MCHVNCFVMMTDKNMTVSVFYWIMWSHSFVLCIIKSCWFWTVHWPMFKIAFKAVSSYCCCKMVVERPKCSHEIIYHNMTVLPVYSSPQALTVKPHDSTSALRFEPNSWLPTSVSLVKYWGVFTFNRQKKPNKKRPEGVESEWKLM